MLRFLLALIRNCGVAVVISAFFAIARGPSHSNRVHAAGALATVTIRPSSANVSEVTECDLPPGRVCRLVDTGQRISRETP